MHRYIRLTLLICGALSAQALPPPMPPIAALRPSATITFADTTEIIVRSTTRRFQIVGLHPKETIDIALQFFGALSSASATAQPLDGGSIISFSIDSSSNLVSIGFRVGSQPGLYRIRVPGVAEAPLLQFWVADPNNPKSNLPVVNPEH